MTSKGVIEAEKLSIGYEKPLITDFSAEIQAGEFLPILGPNGAGKTTFIKTLLGVLKPLSGKLRVLHHNPHQDCQGIGYMPQSLLRPELQHLSARTLLSATAQAYQWGLPRLSKKQTLEIESALEKVEASEFSNKPFGACSGGQQRRIMLAQALLGQPKILLLDEPLANLDFRHQEKFIEILSKLMQDHGVTIMLTTHDLNPLIHLFSRILYIAKGKALLGSFDEVLNAKKLSELYQTPMEVIQHGNRFFIVHQETGHVENVCCEHV